MAFIQLTDQYGNKIAVNVAHICVIRPVRNGAAITMVNNEEVIVKETYAEIGKKII